MLRRALLLHKGSGLLPAIDVPLATVMQEERGATRHRRGGGGRLQSRVACALPQVRWRPGNLASNSRKATRTFVSTLNNLQ
jgi:hypothetical protein